MQPEEETILSCPACWSWQLHYRPSVALQWARWKGGHLDLEPFEEVLEEILREHVTTTCTSPRLFMTLAKERGVI